MAADDVFPPGTRIAFRQPARTIRVDGGAAFAERFAPAAFDGQVGQVVPLTIAAVPGQPARYVGVARLLAAFVDPDGSAVTLTYEVLPG